MRNFSLWKLIQKEIETSAHTVQTKKSEKSLFAEAFQTLFLFTSRHFSCDILYLSKSFFSYNSQVYIQKILSRGLLYWFVTDIFPVVEKTSQTKMKDILN